MNGADSRMQWMGTSVPQAISQESLPSITLPLFTAISFTC